MVDFGAPEREDQDVRLDDYVLDFLPAAMAAVRKAQGSDEVSMVGYCMGGIFSLLYTAAWRDAGVKNLVTIGAPIDFAKLGMLTFVARLAHGQVQFLADKIGNVPGKLNSNALKMLAPVKRITRYADLFVNLWNDEYVRGFDAMSKWTDDFIAYPQAAFKQFMTTFMKDNQLKDGIVFGDKKADLKHITCPLLSFGGLDDQVATPAAVAAIAGKTSSQDHTHDEVPGGHIGVIAGAKAGAQVWEPTAEWLRTRSVKLHVQVSR